GASSPPLALVIVTSRLISGNFFLNPSDSAVPISPPPCVNSASCPSRFAAATISSQLAGAATAEDGALAAGLADELAMLGGALATGLLGAATGGEELDTGAEVAPQAVMASAHTSVPAHRKPCETWGVIVSAHL